MRETRDDLEITAEEVQAGLEQWKTGTLIDVREDWEVARGMLPGALHFPLSAFQDYLGQFDQDNDYIIYCAHGVRSLDAAAWLQQNLQVKARSMAGGVAVWQGPLVIPQEDEKP